MADSKLMLLDLCQKFAAHLGSTKMLSRTVYIDLAKAGNTNVRQKLATIFCKNSKAPKLEVKFNGNEASQTVHLCFFDNTTPLSRGTYTQTANGVRDFELNLLNSSQVETLSARGHYDPNVPFFEWNNCSEKLARRSGYTTAEVDSTGFSLSTKVKDSSAKKAMKDIKSIFIGTFLPT